MAVFFYPASATTVSSSAGSPLSVRLSDGTSSYNTNTASQLPATLGQKAKAASLAVVLASDQDTLAVSAASLPLPTGAATSAKQDSIISALAGTLTVSGAVTQSGTWNINNISGTISLPTGAATAANQSTANTSLASIDGKITECDTGAVVVSSSALPTGAATAANQTTANTSLSSIDGKITACNTGSVTIASSALPTGAATASNQTTANNSLSSIDGKINKGRTAVAKATVDYSASPVTTSAYTELISTVGATQVNEVEIFDSSGSALILATGAAASETDQVYILPGGNGRIPLQIAATTRVAIKALDTNATTGRIIVNFYS